MTSNVTDINALLTGSSSNALTGASGSGTASSAGDFSGTAFQGQLDKVMQQTPDTDAANPVDTAAQSADEVSTVVENQSDVSTVPENTGAGVADTTSAQETESKFSTAQKSNLSTAEQNAQMSTTDKYRLGFRSAAQQVSDVGDALENGTGIEFLRELKSLLLSVCNCDLDNLSLDETGLEALGNLLVQAGFDPASVEELISDLTLTLEETDELISVSDFMDDLFELPLAEEEDITQADVLMPSSDLPFIKSILTMMGMDEQEIASMVDQALEGAQGFDLGEFVEQLEQFLDSAEESGLTFQIDSDDDAYATLLKQLDLDSFIEDSDEPLTLATLANALAAKLDLAQDSLPDQSEQALPELFTADAFDALATDSGRMGLLNQLFTGLSLQEDAQSTVDSTVALGASSNAMIKEIEDRFQVKFMDQLSGEDMGARNSSDIQGAGNTSSADIQSDADDSFTKLVNSFSESTGTTKESASQLAVKAAQADAAALEKTALAASQSTDTTSKSLDSQALVFGVEKSTTTAGVGTSGTQRTQQAFSTLPDFVTRQVGKSIVRSINNGDDTIRMQLRPPELGRVYMSIDHNGSSMKVSVITEHQSAKDILAANVNEIKTMLSSSGVNLESFEVDMSSDFQQSMADARAQDQSSGKQQAKGLNNDDNQEEAAEDLTVQAAVVNDSGSLHFVA